LDCHLGYPLERDCVIERFLDRRAPDERGMVGNEDGWYLVYGPLDDHAARVRRVVLGDFRLGKAAANGDISAKVVGVRGAEAWNGEAGLGPDRGGSGVGVDDTVDLRPSSVQD
jgi:hypothetical protein